MKRDPDRSLKAAAKGFLSDFPLIPRESPAHDSIAVEPEPRPLPSQQVTALNKGPPPLTDHRARLRRQVLRSLHIKNNRPATAVSLHGQLRRRIAPGKLPVLTAPGIKRSPRSHPAPEISTRVERHHPGCHHRSRLLRLRSRRRQLAQPHVPPLGRRSLALQPKVTLAPVAAGSRRHLLPVHRQRQRPIAGFQSIVIPFRRTARMLSRRKSPHPIGPPIRLHDRSMNRKNVAMRRVPLVPPLDIVAIVQHLHLNGPQKRLTRRRKRGRPHENPRIPPSLEMAPLQLKDEILILLHRPQRRHRLPSTAQHPVIPHLPSLRCPVHIHPARQASPAEKRHERFLGSGSRHECRQQERNGTGLGKGFHSPESRRPSDPRQSPR